jgi:hypothetical protein
MVAAGLPAVTANAPSTVALFPGTVASTWAYRREFAGIGGLRVRAMPPVRFAGAALRYRHPVPAAVRHADLRLWRPRWADPPPDRPHRSRRAAAAAVPDFDLWRLFRRRGRTDDDGDVEPADGERRPEGDGAGAGPAGQAANGAAVVWFIAAGAVRWPETLAMLAASVAGGYLGARVTRWLPAAMVRGCIVVLTATVTVAFFFRAI